MMQLNNCFCGSTSPREFQYTKGGMFYSRVLCNCGIQTRQVMCIKGNEQEIARVRAQVQRIWNNPQRVKIGKAVSDGSV